MFLEKHRIKCYIISQENWLSPVIQATWEARTVGWLEVEKLLPPDRRTSVSAISTEDFQVLWRYKEAKLHNASWETGVRVPARLSSQYCNCPTKIGKLTKNSSSFLKQKSFLVKPPRTAAVVHLSWQNPALNCRTEFLSVNNCTNMN